MSEGAAVVLSTQIHSYGPVPSDEMIRRILSMVLPRHQSSSSRVVGLDCLSDLLPNSHMLAHMAAGMLSVPLNGDKGFLVWFRPEFRNTVTYAGKPPDESETVEMGPRASFAAFDQINKLRCRAWTDEDKTAALALAELVSHVCTVENDATEATLVALNQERMKALIIPKSFLCSDFV